MASSHDLAVAELFVDALRSGLGDLALYEGLHGHLGTWDRR